MVNRVTINPPLVEAPEKYSIGTIISIGDERGFSGGVYMLAASGDEGYALLVNLEGGTTRNGLIREDDTAWSVLADTLRENIGYGTKFTVVKSVMVTSKEN